eukprot:scaffold20775_cov109-Isochrysis_galbana.AAC.2
MPTTYKAPGLPVCFGDRTDPASMPRQLAGSELARGSATPEAEALPNFVSAATLSDDSRLRCRCCNCWKRHSS